ncbi:hypothetical protein VNI00_018601 [Paramarasmius palmivorus]|uniref:Uncharacterized protein n=1 Tax=Paramarasmius palmivorus TaxID=297713 RepID=A0AAW0AWD9_9AGAR
MSVLHHLPLLSQLTACDEGLEDPIEVMHLSPLGTEKDAKLPLYAVEFFMGLNYGELKLNMAPNIIYVRSSIKKLLQEQKLAFIPREDVVDKLLEVWEHNEKCKLYERIRYTEVLSQLEYEYSLRTIALKSPLSIIMPDGTRKTYRSPFKKMPQVRLSASVILVINYSARILYNQVALKGRPWKGLVESKMSVMFTHWGTAPPTFARKPNWQRMAHPLDRTDDPVKDILVPKADLPVPDLVSDTSSSTTDSTLDTETVLRLWPRIKPKPETDRWVGWMRNIIDHKLPFADEVVNDEDKRVRSYAKEKSRPYEEVMRTGRASVRYAPYLRPKPKREAKDDISVMSI